MMSNGSPLGEGDGLTMRDVAALFVASPGTLGLPDDLGASSTDESARAAACGMCGRKPPEEFCSTPRPH